MEKALAWLDERIRKSRLITQEETRLISIWCHLADLADGLPVEPKESRKESSSENLHADASMTEPDRENATEHVITDAFDDFSDIDFDFADITETLSKISVIPSGQAAEPTVKPLCFQAGEEDGKALNKALFGTITIEEWAKEDHTLPLRSLVLHQLFSLSWDDCWPEWFSFEQWISAFSGVLELGYHERPVVLFSEDETTDNAFRLLTAENMDAFTQMTQGKMRLGLPFPVLFLHPLKLSVFRGSEENNAALTTNPPIILVRGPLTRKQLQRLVSLKPTAVFVDNESKQEASLISLLEAYTPIAHPLSELNLKLLFRSIDSVYVATKRSGDNYFEEAAAGIEPPLLSLPQAWRIQVATWLRNPVRSWEAFNELFNRVIEHICNDWWLQTQSDPVRTTGVMLHVAQEYQKFILPRLTSYYTDFIRKHPEFTFSPEAEKRSLLETTESYLNKIVLYLETA